MPSAPARGAVLIDANLLLLLVVGGADRNEVERFKRTSRYTGADFDLLRDVVSRFDRLVVTPHVLTEVSNLSGQLHERMRARVREQIARLVPTCDERVAKAEDLVREPLFARLGITDVAIVRAAREPLTVLTDDLPLYVALTQADAEAMSFTHLRAGAWES